MKDIKNYEGLYSITSCGKVWSHKNEMVLKPAPTGRDFRTGGYSTVFLCENGKGKRISIHRLVAQGFIKNPENKPAVNHKNGCRTDNYAQNLEWCTNKENTNHAIKTGLMKDQKGENNNNVKLRIEQVVVIKKLLERGNLSQNSIADFFNVSRGAIKDINIGKSWKKELENLNLQNRRLI